MARLVIKKAEKTDVDQIALIEEECFAIPWSRESIYNDVVNNDKAYWFVACYSEDDLTYETVGYMGVWKILDEGHIMNIAVTNKYRGMGFGKHIMDTMLEVTKEDGITRWTLEVRKSNYIAQNMYESFGFRKAGVREKYYEDNGEDAIIMWRMLENNLN